VNLNLKGKVVIITGANNPLGIGAATGYKFAEEGSKVVLVYKKIEKTYNSNNILENGFDKYYKLNSEDAYSVEQKLCKITKDYLILEKDITEENVGLINIIK